jgi:hypothetical protein
LSLSNDDLSTKTNMETSRVHVYHRLLGKQSWRVGERLNPISSRRVNGEMRYYMRPEALAVFEKALDKISDAQG